MASNGTGREQGAYGVPDRREGVPSDYFHAGDGDVLALLYEKVITGNGEKSLIRKHDDLEGRVKNIETTLIDRADKSERKQNIILTGILGLFSLILAHYIFHIG